MSPFALKGQGSMSRVVYSREMVFGSPPRISEK